MEELFLYPKRRGSINIALCYPNSYSVATSSLAYNKLLGIFIKSGFNVNRFFYEKGKTVNFDKEFNLNKSHIIAFTISFEPDAINALSMLVENNITINKENRSILIIAGGIFPTINDKFFSNVFDYIFKGEIENVENKIIEILKNQSNKNETINLLEKELGFNIHITDPFDNPAHSVIISSDSSFENTFLIEISRGCNYKCAYCLVSDLYRNFRPVPVDKLFEKIDFGSKFSKRIGLVSALTNAHSQIFDIAEYIIQKGAIPLFSSLRLELINEEFLALISKIGQKTLTLGIESANNSIRKKLGKTFTNDFIIDFIKKALNFGIKGFKLYFMAGLPNEENGEREIVDLSKNIRNVFLHYAKENHIMPWLIIDVSLFVPKPFTNWANEKMETKNYYINFIKTLKKELSPIGIEIRSDDVFLSQAQYVLSRADEKICNEIINALQNKGSVKRVIRNYLV